MQKGSPEVFLKANAIVAGLAMAAILLLSLLGYLIDAEQLIADPQTPEHLGLYALGVFFVLFLILSFAVVPLFLRTFVVLQERIGNGQLAIVKLLRVHERGVTYGFWAVYALGTLIALPVMLQDWGFRPGIGKSEGLLVATIDMPLNAVRSQSTLALPDAIHVQSSGERRLIGDQAFDFQIAGTGMRFDNCRYYWIETYEHGDPRVRSISIGVSPRQLSRHALMAAHERVRQRLRDDGWRPGQFNYDTAKERALHGMASSGQGTLWLKEGVFLQLLGKRMDAGTPGENPETAGEWIQSLELRPPTGDYFDAIDFSPASADPEAGVQSSKRGRQASERESVPRLPG